MPAITADTLALSRVSAAGPIDTERPVRSITTGPRGHEGEGFPVVRAFAGVSSAALDLVYNGVIEDTRRGIDETEKLDPVTQDILIGHSAELEKFQWFVRAHLENAGGGLAHGGASTEKSAAKSARRKA